MIKLGFMLGGHWCVDWVWSRLSWNPYFTWKEYSCILGKLDAALCTRSRGVILIFM